MIVISLDTEYVRGREGENYGELAAANHVLCYSATMLEPATGRTAREIVYTAGPEHRHRLYLGGLLGRLLATAQREGMAIPDSLGLVLVMHFSRADLPSVRDFNKIKSKVDGIRGTYATSERPMVMSVRLPCSRRVRCSITLRDTLLLAPAGHGSLAALGESCGLEKIALPDGAIEAMDRLRVEDPDLFERYALRDAEVASAWYRKVADFSRELLGLQVPPVTIGAIAVKLFRKNLAVDLHDLLGQRVVREGRQRRVEWVASYDDVRGLAESCFHGGANYAAVAGFQPEGRRWTDVDLVGAYTSCMAAIRVPDWNAVLECRDPHVLADLDRGIAIARVRFRFPDECRFPSLPVRAGANGLIFPLEGVSCCTGAEILVALNQGAEITVERGVIVPWVPDSAHPFAEFTRHIGALRKQHPKGSVFELLAKEAGNSLYGKLGQGIFQDGRDGGIVPGRAAGKRVFNSRRGSLELIPPSKVSQALLAAYTTGMCRAVLGELVARLPADATVATATTDGMLVDIGLDQIDTTGPVTQFFAGLRTMLTGDPTVLEVKHEATHLLVFRTRGCVSVAGTGDAPILARAGQRLASPLDDNWAEARAWAEIYRTRSYETRHRHRYLIAPRRQWLEDSDLVADRREVRVALDYDLKRRPATVGECQGCLCITETRPWRDRAEFRAWRDDLDHWRNRHRRVLKSLQDWQDFCAWREQEGRHRMARRSSGEMSPFVRAVLVAWSRGEAGLPRHSARGRPAVESWTTVRIASVLTGLIGSPVTAKMVEKAATRTVVPVDALTDRDLEIAAAVQRIVPGARLHEIVTRASGYIFPRESDVPETRAGAGEPDGSIPNSPDVYGGIIGPGELAIDGLLVPGLSTDIVLPIDPLPQLALPSGLPLNMCKFDRVLREMAGQIVFYPTRSLS